MEQLDPHHCRCFSIPKEYFTAFKDGLKKLGFGEPFSQEPHDQVFGLTKYLDEYKQIHVKMMPSGNIECEIEYRPQYLIAHLNQLHSYSGHPELQEILGALRIPHSAKIIPPLTCIKRKIIDAVKPTHVVGFIVLTALVVGSIAAISYAARKENKD